MEEKIITFSKKVFAFASVIFFSFILLGVSKMWAIKGASAMGIVLFIAILAAFVVCLYVSLSPARTAVRLDKNGIVTYSLIKQKPVFSIAWSDIEGFGETGEGRIEAILIYVKDAEKYIQKEGKTSQTMSRLGKKMLGTSFVIPYKNLAISKAEFVDDLYNMWEAYR